MKLIEVIVWVCLCMCLFSTSEVAYSNSAKGAMLSLEEMVNIRGGGCDDTCPWFPYDTCAQRACNYSPCYTCTNGDTGNFSCQPQTGSNCTDKTETGACGEILSGGTCNGGNCIGGQGTGAPCNRYYCTSP